MRNVHAKENGTALLQVHHAMTQMRGPMTRAEIREALAARESKEAP